MAEHEAEKGSAPRPLNKALWMQTLDELEREFFAYQQRSSSPLAGAKLPTKSLNGAQIIPNSWILSWEL